MASSNPSHDPFEPSQVSSLVSAEASLQFLKEHGFFYQENATIGKLVDDLFTQDHIRNPDVELAYFKPALQQDPRLKAILDHFAELPRFRFPWGVPGYYYNWVSKSSPTANHGVIAYMIAPRSVWHCLDGSTKLDSDGEMDLNGVFTLPDSILNQYPRQEVRMEKGGILLVYNRFAHSAECGRSIIIGLKEKKQSAAS